MTESKTLATANCRGSIRLGSACMKCKRCAQEMRGMADNIDGEIVTAIPAKPAPLLNLFDKIRLAREGSAVERCHTHPHLQRYSVGQHSLDLVTLITFAWKETYGTLPSSQLLLAAAFHDIPERIFGDFPQPVKVLLGGRLDEAEDQVLKHLGMDFDLPALDREFLAVADKVELYLWAQEEASRGNSYFLEWCRDYDEYFRNNPPPEVFIQIMTYSTQNCGARLSFKLLKQVAGL